MDVKEINWIDSSLNDIKKFPSEARSEIGHQLYKVQNGLASSDWKSMLTIGQGVKEIRVHVRNEYRVIYVAKFKEAIYVLHGFLKKNTKNVQKRY